MRRAGNRSKFQSCRGARTYSPNYLSLSLPLSPSLPPLSLSLGVIAADRGRERVRDRYEPALPPSHHLVEPIFSLGVRMRSANAGLSPFQSSAAPSARRALRSPSLYRPFPSLLPRSFSLPPSMLSFV